MKTGQNVLVFKALDFYTKNIFSLLKDGEFKVGFVYNEHTYKDTKDSKFSVTTYAYDKYSSLCKDYVYKSCDSGLSEYVFMTRGQIIDLFNMIEVKNPQRKKAYDDLLKKILEDHFNKN